MGIMVLFPPVSQDKVGYRAYNHSYYQITENSLHCRQFLDEVRINNPVNRICLIIVKEKARALDIELIYLPPYSPDLNPIEYLWKSIKRIISASEIENKLELIEIVRDSFLGLAANLSSARSWIPRFLHDKLYMLC